MTATESDTRDARVGGGEGTVHCAVHSPEETPDAGPNARPRVRTREVSGESAQPQDDSAPAVDLGKHPDPVTWRDRLADVREVFTPPDIWSTDRPSLSLMWAYAARGDWTGEAGLPRRAGQAYAVLVAVPVTAVTYLLAWAAERPSRLIAAVVLLVVLFRVPPLAWLI